MSATRIYLVTNQATGAKCLAKATNQASALRAVTTAQFRVEVASQEALVELIGAGAQVIDATKVPDEPPEQTLDATPGQTPAQA